MLRGRTAPTSGLSLKSMGRLSRTAKRNSAETVIDNTIAIANLRYRLCFSFCSDAAISYLDDAGGVVGGGGGGGVDG